MRRKRLIWQFVFAYSAISIAGMMVAGLHAAHSARCVYLDEIADELQRGARAAGERIAPLDGGVQARCEDLSRILGIRITVVAPDGVVLADSDNDPAGMENHADRPEIATALGGGIGRAEHYSYMLGEDRLYVALPIDRTKGLAAVVRTSIPVRTFGHTLYHVYGQIALVGMVMIGAITALSFWASRRILRPLEEIRAGAQRLARGDLQHRLRIADANEIALLAEALNEMAGQLDERVRTIRRQQDENDAIVSSMEEGVLAVDCASTIINLNEACARMLGVTAEQARGRFVHEVVRKRELLLFIENAVAADAPIDGDLQVLGRPDRWFRGHGIAMHDTERRKIGALIVLHDVTRLRHLENVRRDFVANVSHELKTPITSIKGFVETLLEESLEDKENSLRFLNIVLRQANRLNAIIEDLLSLSRIERGAEEQTIPLENAGVADVLHSAAEMCEKKASDKNVRLVVRCSEDLTGKINAPLLEQAVVNLVDNAVKYSPSGTAVHIGAEREGEGILIRVRDEGCGIAGEHLPRLFERFYRVDRARSRELGGTGLGLAIVKHIVAAHRGRVHVESAPGKGSTFFIHLPSLD